MDIKNLKTDSFVMSEFVWEGRKYRITQAYVSLSETFIYKKSLFDDEQGCIAKTELVKGFAEEFEHKEFSHKNPLHEELFNLNLLIAQDFKEE